MDFLTKKIEMLVHKVYKKPFVVDEKKLSRVLTIIEQRMTTNEIIFDSIFEIKFCNNKNITLASIDEVFKLDNAVKNPITSLKITMCSKVGENVTILFSSGIEIIIDSKIEKQANALCAELEEQIERMLQHNWFFSFLKIKSIFKGSYSSDFLNIMSRTILPAISIGFIFSYLSSLIFSSKGDEKAKELSILKLAHTDSEKLDALIQVEINKIKPKEYNITWPTWPSVKWPSIFILRNFFFILPFLLIFGAFFYLIIFCYPQRVFYWGDWEEYYKNLLDRRKLINYGILVALLIGVIGNLFVSSIRLSF